MNAGDGDVGPYSAVATKNHSRIGDAVATQRHAFTKHGSEFAQATGDSLSVEAKMYFSSVIPQVAEFGPSAEVDVFSEDGIAYVVEMWRFGPRKKNGVLYFRRMANHGVGTNPGEFADIGPATHDGSWTDVARANQVGSSLNGRRRLDDDAFSSGEKPGVVNADVAVEGLHLGFQSRNVVGVKHLPHWPVWEGGEVAAFSPGKGGKER